MNYYNDNDPKSVAWLRELIKQKVIPTGEVDERSIKDVTGSDLKGYTQCHFFAGIGGWAEALRIAGVSPDTPLWSGSPPCQPFSCAGKQQGEKDERHLWPEFYRLIRECRPTLIFGEQVESSEVVGTQLEANFIIAVRTGEYARANKLAKRLITSKSFHYYPRWIDRVQADLGTENYSVGFAILGAHSVNAPHIRQRLYWVADSNSINRTHVQSRRKSEFTGIGGGGKSCGMADSKHYGSNRTATDETKSGSDRENNGLFIGSGGELCTTGGMERPAGNGRDTRRAEPDERGASGRCGESRMADSESSKRERDRAEQNRTQNRFANGGELSFWSDSIWLPCADGKARRVKSEIFPLVDGISGRVGLLRGSGNAIVPETAAEFIKAYMEISEEVK